MQTHFLQRIMKIPVLGEVLGAMAGCTVALLLYGIYSIVRALI